MLNSVELFMLECRDWISSSMTPTNASESAAGQRSSPLWSVHQKGCCHKRQWLTEMSPKSGLFTKSTYLVAMFAFNKQKLSATQKISPWLFLQLKVDVEHLLFCLKIWWPLYSMKFQHKLLSYHYESVVH